MVSRIPGVIRLDRDIQLKRWARQRNAKLQTSSVWESRGTYGEFLDKLGVALVGVRVMIGVVEVGVARRCGNRERPCEADVGVPNGDEAWEVGAEEEEGGGVAPLERECLIGDTLGEGGGVGVTECSCFSTMESKICMRAERMVETFCCISIFSWSLLCEVMRSERGQASSSEAV